MKKLLASGIFGWDGSERRSDRYGSIHLDPKPYDAPDTVEVVYNQPLLASMLSKRVRLTCKVLVARKSGHLGDLFHKIFPSTPDVGEIVDLGVGLLGVEKGYDGNPHIVLKPNDGRTTMWVDPRKLYRLHDQTVEVYVEETEDDFSPAPDLCAITSPEGVGLDDGFMQVKGAVENGFVVPAKISSLGDGCFLVSNQRTAGERFPIAKKR